MSSYKIVVKQQKGYDATSIFGNVQKFLDDMECKYQPLEYLNRETVERLLGQDCKSVSDVLDKAPNLIGLDLSATQFLLFFLAQVCRCCLDRDQAIPIVDGGVYKVRSQRPKSSGRFYVTMLQSTDSKKKGMCEIMTRSQLLNLLQEGEETAKNIFKYLQSKGVKTAGSGKKVVPSRPSPIQEDFVQPAPAPAGQDTSMLKLLRASTTYLADVLSRCDAPPVHSEHAKSVFASNHPAPFLEYLCRECLEKVQPSTS